MEEFKGTKIKEKLASNEKTQRWLIIQLHSVGIKVDPGELSHILAGTLRTPKADLVIETSEAIIKEYEKSGRFNYAESIKRNYESR